MCGGKASVSKGVGLVLEENDGNQEKCRQQKGKKKTRVRSLVLAPQKKWNRNKLYLDIRKVLNLRVTMLFFTTPEKHAWLQSWGKREVIWLKEPEHLLLLPFLYVHGGKMRG